MQIVGASTTNPDPSTDKPLFVADDETVPVSSTWGSNPDGLSCPNKVVAFPWFCSFNCTLPHLGLSFALICNVLFSPSHFHSFIEQAHSFLRSLLLYVQLRIRSFTIVQKLFTELVSRITNHLLPINLLI